MKPVSQLPDLMQQIEELRVESRRLDITGDEYRANVCQREALREQLRTQRHIEHMADMALAQSMGECHFASLDPTPHRQVYAPAKAPGWLASVLGCVALVGIGTALALQFFGVLVL